MNRRSFLQRIGAAAVALTLARHLPGIAPAPLRFAPEAVPISVRHITRWDEATASEIHRIDIVWGVSTLRPEFAVRVVSQPTLLERFRVRVFG